MRRGVSCLCGLNWGLFWFLFLYSTSCGSESMEGIYFSFRMAALVFEFLSCDGS